MCLKVLQALLCYIVVCVIAFEDLIYVYGQVSEEIVEQGRRQYQLLQERGNLPKYGDCWKLAVQHVEEGCKDLSEETQSDMALHLTNCFLDMSGHQTYNCNLDKKPNLKSICFHGMTDRAFHVYTEFYAHTQNMCWFLRAQVWHETIAENTLRVGKQLESSARNQEEILRSQRESLALQETLLRYGQNLEKVMGDFDLLTKSHQEILSAMSVSLQSLQSWLIGELSWFELIVFYVSAAVLITIFTSSRRTAAARLPVWSLLVLNAITERLICAVVIAYNENDVHLVQDQIYKYTWWLRKTCITLSILILVYKTCRYTDMMQVNNTLLRKIYNQNLIITEQINGIKKGSNSVDISNGHFSVIDENISVTKTFDSPSFDIGLNRSHRANGYLMEQVETHKKSQVLENGDIDNLRKSFNFYKTESLSTPKNGLSLNKTIGGRQRISPVLNNQSSGKYNLRSRHGTPTSNV